jgi:hypothetical protein
LTPGPLCTTIPTCQAGLYKHQLNHGDNRIERPTLHETNFNRLKEQAGHALRMDPQVKAYDAQTPGAEAVLENYNPAKNRMAIDEAG